MRGVFFGGTLLLFATGCVHRPPPIPGVLPPNVGPRLPMPAGEIRGVWIADPRGLDWDRIARDLAPAHINTVFVKFSTGGAAHYPSGLLPFSGGRRDEVVRCLRAMHRYGIAVHAWHVGLQMKDASSADIRRAISENRVQRDRYGAVLYPSYKGVAILCPSYPPNRALEARAVVELARLGFDGVQLDHIRFADGDSCYCSNCRVGFEQFVGRRVAWPRDVVAGAPLRSQFLAYRQTTVTHLVYDIRRDLNASGSRVPLSAAVFADLQDARLERGQDWKVWVDTGYLEMLCPMNYNTSFSHFDQRLRADLAAVGGRVPIAVGIGIYLDHFTPSLMLQQISDARRAGAKGFVLFNYDDRLARTFLPSLR